MSTTVPIRTCGNTPATPLTPTRILSAPLPELLAEVGAEIVDAPAQYDSFEGVALRPQTGPIQVVLPKGRSAQYRDTMARALVGQLFGTDLKPLPASLDVRTYGGAR